MKHLVTTLAFSLFFAFGCGGGTADTAQPDDTAQTDDSADTARTDDTTQPDDTAGVDAEHCRHEGGLVPRGTDRDASDGCNTCTCEGNDEWACTEMACPDEPEPEAP